MLAVSPTGPRALKNLSMSRGSTVPLARQVTPAILVTPDLSVRRVTPAILVRQGRRVTLGRTDRKKDFFPPDWQLPHRGVPPGLSNPTVRERGQARIQPHKSLKGALASHRGAPSFCPDYAFKRITRFYVLGSIRRAAPIFLRRRATITGVLKETTTFPGDGGAGCSLNELLATDATESGSDRRAGHVSRIT